MALPWVRLDTQFASNPKILALIEARKHRAAFAWVCSLGYAGVHGTDGFLPSACLPFVHATKADAADLVRVGLWNQAPGGWEINGWSEFQLSGEEHQERRRRAELASKKANCVRWHGEDCGCWRTQ